MPPLWWGNGFAYKDMCVLSVVKTWTMFTGHLIFTPSRALYVTLARANTMQLKAANVTHAAHVTNAIRENFKYYFADFVRKGGGGVPPYP